MRKPKFDEYVGSGYWVSRHGEYRAIIRAAIGGWYGGACEAVDGSVPLLGPYRLKWNAKRVAMRQLSLLREEVGR